MLREISVANFALIDELSLEFERGFTIFTGETGAGKSILVGAINLLLGERASVDQIRMGAEEAEVCGIFDVRNRGPALNSLLQELSISPQDDTLIVRRRIARNDRNKIFVNQVPLPLSSLKKIGDGLVDLHGQHEHQSLLNEETHAAVIDDLPEVAGKKDAYSGAYAAFAASRLELETFEAKAAALAERKEVLEFQHKELADLNVRPGEEEALENELRLLSSSAQRTSAVSEIMTLLTDPDDSIGKKVSLLRRKMETLAKYDPAVSPWLADVADSQSVFSQLETFCGSYLEHTGSTADPARIEYCNARLSKIQRLRKKYTCSLEGLIAKREALKKDLSAIVNTEADRAEMAKKAAADFTACTQAGATLSRARKRAAAVFDAKVTRLMAQLGFDSGLWRTDFLAHDDPLPGGLEEVRFMVQTNRGEPLLPLIKTASGGEISRLMLAIKTVLSEHDRIPVLIFDEIDTGIGGVLAGRVADALKGLSRSHQVLCISHLHQIASLADHHFHVYKQPSDGRTVTRVKRLSEPERVDEVARMLGGDSFTAKKHAEELLNKRCL